MIWTLEWTWVAKRRDIFAIGDPPAERICAALHQLAETGRPRPERVNPNDPNRFRLRVEGAEARLFVDREARVIVVARVGRLAGYRCTTTMTPTGAPTESGPSHRAREAETTDLDHF